MMSALGLAGLTSAAIVETVGTASCTMAPTSAQAPRLSRSHRNVSSWPTQAGHEANLHGIANGGEDDGCRCCGRLCCDCSRCRQGGQYIHLVLNQVACHGRQSTIFTFGPMVSIDDVPTHDEMASLKPEGIRLRTAPIVRPLCYREARSPASPAAAPAPRAATPPPRRRAA